MTDEELAARRLVSHQGFLRALGGEELPGGIVAGVVRAAPERSIVNSVAYADGDALLGSLDALARLYADAGVRAWTVWVPEADVAVAEALERAGHTLDGVPTAMAAELSAMDLAGDPPAGTRGVGWEEIAAINDTAYEQLPPGSFPPMLSTLPPTCGRRYAVPAQACLAVLDHAGDAAVEFVATRPEHRGRGLAGALLRHALREAHERGCTTTSLEASAAGRPLYERMGYRSLGALQMWERRTG